MRRAWKTVSCVTAITDEPGSVLLNYFAGRKSAGLAWLDDPKLERAESSVRGGARRD